MEGPERNFLKSWMNLLDPWPWTLSFRVLLAVSCEWAWKTTWLGVIAVRAPCSAGVHSIRPLESRYVTVTPMPGVAVVAGAARVEVRQRLPAASMVKTEECMVVPMIERNTNWNVGILG